jgi:hypothetical protein
MVHAAAGFRFVGVQIMVPSLYGAVSHVPQSLKRFWLDLSTKLHIYFQFCDVVKVAFIHKMI